MIERATALGTMAVPMRAVGDGRGRATRVLAGPRLRADLRSIVLDVLGVCDTADLPDETRIWAERVAETAVGAVCDTSVSRLLDAIDASMAEVPPEVAAHFAEAALRQDAGID